MSAQQTAFDNALLLKAAHFAAQKHRDQRRKGRHATPYINHPLEVAQRLATLGGVRDVKVLSAAVLHDTIEDTATTSDELVAEFGAGIAELVLEVTDDKSLPKQERKRLQIAHAPEKSENAKLIKLSDKTSNVIDMGEIPPDWPVERKRAYLDWARSVVAGLRGVSPALEAEFDRALAEARIRVG